MLLCECIPGDEFSVDMMVQNGHTLAIAARRRDKIVSGISVSGTFVRNEAIENASFKIAKLLNLHGPIGMQYKLDKNQAPVLLEINPRLQGAVSSALLAGINFPLMAVHLALNNFDVNASIVYAKAGIGFNRYWTDIQAV